ncbi:monooxygenase 2 [Daucus carota subsp. sativus]|uniref:FAD-binding domain-containing protein n=1 Tax=Daucus carota subsp. sativus TaxID=79200 RepID=A0A166GAX2_DAUCS|nr:PREDICTED: FAD-dependent urate hydroxylase-like [Daucus carota subsp. sativus]
MERVEEVVIVGAGICGLAIAVALRRYGIQAVVVERAESLRTTGASITLASNAWLALEALGVSHKLNPHYPTLNKSVVTNLSTGAVQISPFPPNQSGRVGPKTVHRKALLEVLGEELPRENIRFSCKITSISTELDGQGSSIALLLMEDGSHIKAKVLIGCDGVHSQVARWLGLGEPVDSGRFGLRALSVYPQGHGLDHDVFRFTHTGFNGGFVPFTKTDLYLYLTTLKSRDSGEEGITAKTPPELIQKYVIEHYCKDFPPEYLDVVNHVDVSTLTWAPLKLRLPWNVIFGKLSKGTITVAGDAMHPMTPDLGQGGCCALEDAVVLGRCIGNTYLKNGQKLVSSEVAKAIDEYVEARRWRVAGVITASFISGWVQDGSSWLKRFVRDAIFYRFFAQYASTVINYDCGSLPRTSAESNPKQD